jgi:hypothetical protein
VALNLIAGLRALKHWSLPEALMLSPLRIFRVSGLLLLLSITGCAPKQSASSARPGPEASPAAASRSSAEAGNVTAQLTSTEIVVGENRFTLGLLDSAGKPIADASARLTFYDLGSGQPITKAQVDATFQAPAREAGLAETISVTLPNGQKRVQSNAPSDVGIYEAQVSFDHAGDWGVEAQGKLKSGAPYAARAGFKVAATGATPAVGSPAPESHNLTTADTSDLSQLDSSANPTADMHTESIADGIAAGHPLLVLFASPGYCSSRFCGPELELARKLEPQYKGRVDFIHVEIYKDPSQRIPVDAVDEWRLPSEPWFFLVDGKGIVRAKFEGPTGMKELDLALQKIAG